MAVPGVLAGMSALALHNADERRHQVAEEQKNDAANAAVPPPISDNRDIHIHVNQDNEQAIPAKMPERTLWTMVSGGIGAVIGYASAAAYATLKMLKFDGEYHAEARKDFVGKNGIGAASADIGTMDNSIASFGRLGPGMASPEITETHRLKLINSGKYPFPKFLEVVGGKGTFALGVAAVTGLAAAGIYRLTHPAKPDQDWQSKVHNENDPTRHLG